MKTNADNISLNFKSVWKSDFISGFLVFLLALPLSLGIAKASEFPAAMGVLTAMLGGLVTVFFKVSELSIKGPAAGLITIAAAAVIELGGEEDGWKMACGAIVVMAVLQMLFGFLKFGTLSDLFPHAVIHGMLASIGLIIIAKQIPVLLGVDPTLYADKSPFELYAELPIFIRNASWKITTLGLLGLTILFALPLIKINFFKKIPAPLIVLIIAVPLALFLDFKTTQESYALVTIGDFWGSLSINADFSAMGSFIFWKYVIMFLFVSSLESLLTAKALDNLDPYKRQTNYNGDLVGQGFGNAISGLLGGLPMISEVVRSTSNITYGAKTKLSNFFHGFFLLISMLVLIPVIEMIPNSALAAMLIFAGYRLTAPKEFLQTYKIGKEQLAIFVTTIFVTLAEDLLLGVFAGILLKLIFHATNGVKFSCLFRAQVSVEHNKNGSISIHIFEAAIFTHLLKLHKILDRLPKEKSIILIFENCNLIDHSYLEFINQYKRKYENEGGKFQLVGIEALKPVSAHSLATRKKD
jgi:MFS superfamily sulfate permease-like transporter